MGLQGEAILTFKDGEPHQRIGGVGDSHVDYAPCGFLAGQCVGHVRVIA
jgi:hypothetical protein